MIKEYEFVSTESRVKRTEEDIEAFKRMSPRIHSRSSGTCWCGTKHY